MRFVAIALCAALVGYVLGSTTGQARAPARADRARRVEAPGEGPLAAPSGRMLAPDAASVATWQRMVDLVPCPPPLEETGRIRGVVRDAQGQPLAGAVVKGVPGDFPGAATDLAGRARRFVSRRKWEALSERRAVTDASGSYELDGLGDALYSLSASLDGYSVDRWWNVHPGAVSDFRLSPAVVLSVRILLPDGRPAPFARLRLSQPGTVLSGPWSPAEGTRVVDPGVWSLKATHPVLRTLASQAVEVDAKWGATPAPVVLRLAERPWIRGSMRLATGAVPQAARLYLRPWQRPDLVEGAASGPEGAEIDLEDAKEGTFAFYDVDPGAYRVFAAVPGGDAEGHTLVEVREGVTEVHLVVSGDPRPETVMDVLDDVTPVAEGE